MVLMRNGRALVRRVDSSQLPIVLGLRQAGYRVWQIEEPADLLVYGWSNRLNAFKWTVLECKTPQKNGRRLKRNDQKEQDKFLAETHTPVVTTLDEALEALR
jgi:hypothetical protein